MQFNLDKVFKIKEWLLDRGIIFQQTNQAGVMFCAPVFSAQTYRDLICPECLKYELD